MRQFRQYLDERKTDKIPDAKPIASKNPPQPVDKSGLAFQGEKKMVYEPDTSTQKPFRPCKTKTTESFLAGTKGMSPSQFAEHAAKMYMHGVESLPDVVAPQAGPFKPDPNQAIRYVANLIKVNENALAALVQEAKRVGCLGSLTAELFRHNESYLEFASLMQSANGPSCCRQLASAIREVDLSEVTGPPASDGMMSDRPRRRPRPDDVADQMSGMGGDDEGDDDDDMHASAHDDSEGDDDMGDEDDEDMGDEGDDDMGDDDDGEGDMGDMGDEDNPNSHIGDEMGDEGDMGGDGNGMVPPPRPKKRRSAGMNLRNAIKGMGMDR